MACVYETQFRYEIQSPVTSVVTQTIFIYLALKTQSDMFVALRLRAINSRVERLVCACPYYTGGLT